MQADWATEHLRGSLDVLAAGNRNSAIRIHQKIDHHAIGHDLVQKLQPLWLQFGTKSVSTGEIEPRAIESSDELVNDRIAGKRTHDRNGCGGRPERERGTVAAGGDNGDPPPHQISGEGGKAVIVALSPSILDGCVAAIYEAGILQASQKC